ncbi:MAG: dephospho-CoA kinase [Dehalococcoidia bacterium]|nr:dephospho-CoA kinase [Dehalococcoidia bacterium]
MIVVLTGSVGTGKSTVAGFFRELGAYVVDFDELAREVTRPHSRAWEKIVEFFGRDVLNEDLTINRQRLADIVFCDHDKLARLNEIVHPEVFEQDERITAEIRERDSDALVIKDIPLFYEVSCPISVDSVIVVAASEQTQLRRLEKKAMSLEDASRRIKAQLPIDYKSRRADFVIDNDGSLEETKRQVEAIYCLLRGRS